MPEHHSVAYKVKVNEFEFCFTHEQIDAIDILKISPTRFNLLQKHRSVNASLIQADGSAKMQTLEIEGAQFEIQIKDELDLKLDKMGYSIEAVKKTKEVIAPMPGLVLQIAVSEGQQVHEGDTILILVAMKMENSITIHTGATIQRIAVRAGQAVEKGQVLVELA